MDPQTVLIGIAIFVISAILIYLIAAITMREKTYEEVMAEQKKRQEEEREKMKNDKKMEKELMKKKYKKGKGDKSKEKSAQVSEPELKESPKAQQKEHKMVNLEIEPEIIEPSESMVLSSSSTKPRNRMSAHKKSILHNKDEVTPVTEKPVELPHKPIKPLDDVELKKLHEAQAQQPSPKKEKGGQAQTELRHEVKEVVKEAKVQKVRSSPVEAMEVQQGTAVEEKKVTKSKSATGVEGSPSSVNGAQLVNMVRSASLNDQEVQTLIDILLNRQGAAAAASHESWNKKSQKGDPMAMMKKQLEEKERALQEEQQLAMSSNNRVKELRNELTAERTKLSTLEKHFQEEKIQQMEEQEALQARMRHAHEQHTMETHKLQAHIQQLEKSGDAAMVQKLKQENRILQESLSKASMESVSVAEVNNLRQKVAIMEKELSSNAVRINSSENAKKSYEDKLKKYEDQIKKLESTKTSEDSLAKKLEEVTGALRKAESKNGGLNTDLKKATAALTSAEGEYTTLKTRLQELEKHLSVNNEMGAKLQESERKKQELEGNMKNLEKQLADTTQLQEGVTRQLQESERKKQELEGNMKNLEKQLVDNTQLQEGVTRQLQESERKKQELEGNMKNLEKQLVNTVQVQEGVTRQLQDSERKKQEMDGNMTNLEKQLADSVQRQGDMGMEIQRIRQENLTLIQEVKLAKERLQNMEAVPAATNGDIHSEGSGKDVIDVTEHERIVSEKVATVQSELEVQQHSSLTQITELKTQLDAQKQKNNELREKNWKAMEALEKAEKSAAEKVDKSLKSSRENVTKAVTEVEKRDRDVLKHLFPAVSVSDKLAHREWLVSFEKQAAHQLAQTSKSEKSVTDKLTQLEEENSHLQAEVEVFRTNIAILHSEKNRIDELEEENRKFEEQSESYKKQCIDLNAERERLQQVEKENQRLKSIESSYSSLPEEVSLLQAENQELQSQLVEKDSSITEAERKLHNLEHVVETEEKKWKEKLRLAEEKASRETESSSHEQELEQLTTEQQTQIEHYRTVLLNTESVLQKLESEERSWEEKLQVSQKDLQQAKSECQRIQTEFQTSAKGNTLLQREMESLHQELKQAIDRLQVLSREKEELTGKMIVLETQSKAVVQVDKDDLKRQMEELQVQLDKEQKKAKDLSATVVRLNGIIKTGQDALTQEQKLVQHLQEQLDEKTKGSGASANQEIQQVRA